MSEECFLTNLENDEKYYMKEQNFDHHKRANLSKSLVLGKWFS